MEWNKKQEMAISHRRGNLLVSAGAGSGKTAVLVQRIIDIITDKKEPIDIDRLLVVTFTNKAASEMKERISKALIDKADDQNERTDNLTRQLMLLKNSNIMTIHSFCLSIIRKYFHKIDIDPDFKVADETESKLLKLKAIDKMKEVLCLEPKYIKLLKYYGFEKEGRKIENIIFDLDNFIVNIPFREDWIDKVYNILRTKDLMKSEHLKIIHKYIEINLQGIKNDIEQFLDVLSIDEDFSGYYEIFTSIKEDIDASNELFKKSFESGIEYLSEYKLPRLPRTPKDANEEIKEFAKNKKTGYSKILKEIITDFNIDYESILQDNMEFEEIFNLIISIYEEYEKIYKELKKEKNIIDFNDIERYCLNILVDRNDEAKEVNDEVCKDIRKEYEYIFIDEYQDSNITQEKILNAVSRMSENENNIFMVGDVKQSIYKFRSAMPEIFLEKYNTYDKEEGKEKRKINLGDNYRSRSEILQFINKVFEKLMNDNVSEISYGEDEMLNSARNYPKLNDENTIDITIYDKEETLKDIDEEEYKNIEKEAFLIKNKIDKIVGNLEVYDDETGVLRKIKYSDIVILTRSGKNVSGAIKDILTQNDIPAFSKTDEGYFDQLEIRLLVSFLKVLDNPYQDIDLMAVMRSFIGDIDIDTITKIRLYDKKSYLYDNLQHYIKEDKKVFKLVKNIVYLRRLKNIIQIDELIELILKDFKFFEYFNTFTNAKVRTSNLRLIIKKASDFEEENTGGLYEFLNYVSNINKKNVVIESAKAIGENENVVRIMTIHSSKGLEFPIVFLANASKQFNRSDEKKDILFHKDYALGYEKYDRERKIRYSSIYKKALKKQIELENIAEELRIMYVALTRAKERLYIFGGIKKADEYFSKYLYSNNILPYDIINSKSYLDWILNALNSIFKIKIKDGNANCGNLAKIYIKSVDQYAIKKEKNKEQIDIRKNKVPIDYIKKRFKEIDLITDVKKYPAKISVTELKKYKYDLVSNDVQGGELIKDNKSDFANIKPKFLEETRKLDPKERGILYHYIMQIIDFKAINSYESLKEAIDKLVNKKIISKFERDNLNINQIYSFFNTKIAKDIMKSKVIKKETPFNVELDLKENAEHDNTILQGIIDLYYEKDDKLVLVDYKTDILHSYNEKILIDKYKKQIDYYKYALEKITKREVISKYIYSFYLEKIISL